MFQKFVEKGAVPLYQEGQTKGQWESALQQEIYQRVLAKGLDADSARLITADVMGKITAPIDKVDTTVNTAFRKGKPDVTALLTRWGYYDPSQSLEPIVIDQFRNNPDLRMAVGQ